MLGFLNMHCQIPLLEDDKSCESIDSHQQWEWPTPSFLENIGGDHFFKGFDTLIENVVLCFNLHIFAFVYVGIFCMIVFCKLFYVSCLFYFIFY